MPKLNPAIRREERTCPVHGRTTFAFYESSKGLQTPRCMACSRATSAIYDEQIRTGARKPERPYNMSGETNIKVGAICPVHFIAKSLDGTCGSCE